MNLNDAIYYQTRAARAYRQARLCARNIPDAAKSLQKEAAYWALAARQAMGMK